MAATKTVCPISRGAFLENAKPVVVTVDGQRMAAGVKEFSTKSLGWHASGKTVIEVGGVPCEVQVGVTLTIIGSKEAE